MKKIYTLSIFLITVFIVANPSFAQKQAWKWYFGYNCAMDFSSGAPVALYNSAMSMFEGSASISDENGNLLFYTDGLSVWNRNHIVMPNGFGLLGDYSATQSAIIVPKPGSNTIYYIFTTSMYEARYSEVDITLQGGLGDVTSVKNVLLSNNSSEKLTAVRAANGEDIWVAIHEKNNNYLKVYLVTSGGVNSTPVISAVGNVLYDYIGQLKFSPNGKKAAMASLGSPTGQTVEVFDFDNSTGIFSNPFGIPTLYNQTYGLEFSPDSKLLYSGSFPGTQNINQFNLEAGTPADIIASNTIVGIADGTAGTFQIGPDQKVYLAQENSVWIAVINNPNVIGTGCNFVSHGIDQSPHVSGLGLPNYVSSFFLPITIENFCLGDSTHFLVSDSASYADVFWNFDDPSSGAANADTGVNVYHIFSAQGSYDVQIIYNYTSGNIDTVTTSVSIYTFPIVNIGNDTLLCIGDTMILDAGNAGYTFLWSDNSTGQTLLVNTAGCIL
jgi:hypothetical protein